MLGWPRRLSCSSCIWDIWRFDGPPRTPYSELDARRSLGLVAVIQVPLVYFSVTLWRTLHQPMTVRPDGIQMDGSMVGALFTNWECSRCCTWRC